MNGLTEDRRAVLDAEVLRALATRSTVMTYVIRNVIDWPGRPLHRKGIDTAAVLRPCRRLEKQGYVEQGRSSYSIQLAWVVTPAGREALRALEGQQ